MRTGHKGPKGFFLLLATGLLMLSTAWADAPALKIGVVNIAALLKQAPQAKEADARLKNEFAPQQAALKEMAEKLEALRKAYEKDKLTLSEEQKAEREKEIVMMSREFQRRRAAIQEVVNLRRNEELAKLQTLINKAIHAIGQADQYDLILYDGIAFSSTRIDLTPRVMEYLKKQKEDTQKSFNQ